MRHQPFAPPTPPPGTRIRKVRPAPPYIRRRAEIEDAQHNGLDGIGWIVFALACVPWAVLALVLFR